MSIWVTFQVKVMEKWHTRKHRLKLDFNYADRKVKYIIKRDNNNVTFHFQSHATKFHALSPKNNFQMCVRKFCFNQWEQIEEQISFLSEKFHKVNIFSSIAKNSSEDIKLISFFFSTFYIIFLWCTLSMVNIFKVVNLALLL